MFQFLEGFNQLSNEKVVLKIYEKVQGNEVLLPFYYYDIYEKDTYHRIGKISIRIGYNESSYFNGHIGYEIDEPYRGKHYAYYAMQLVLEVAKAHQMKYVYLTCKESNKASKKTIEKIKARFIETAQIPKECFFWHKNIEKYCIYLLEL